MKSQKSCGPRLGKLVHQLPGVVTFAYDLRFRRVIARWKGIIEEIHFGDQSCLWLSLRISIPKNLHLGPQNGPEVKTTKNSKLPKMSENCFEPVGKGGWPPISIWIIQLPNSMATNSYVLWLQLEGGYNHISLPHLAALKYKCQMKKPLPHYHYEIYHYKHVPMTYNQPIPLFCNQPVLELSLYQLKTTDT
jgi:hypothetical protein